MKSATTLIQNVSKHKMKAHYYILALLIGLILICCSKQSSDYKPFADYDFNTGDYKLYGFISEGGGGDFFNKHRDFYIDNKDILNVIKSSWIFDSTEKRMACGFEYILCLTKSDSLLFDLSTNSECRYMVSDTWYDFNPNLWTKIPDEHVKHLERETAKQIQNRLFKINSKQQDKKGINHSENADTSVVDWKTHVLRFVKNNLDSLYKLDSDNDKTDLLKNYAEFIEKNDNGKYYRIGPKSIFSEDWFYELGYLKLFREVQRLDTVINDFNGFEFLYRIKFMYNSMIEPSEVLSADLSEMAYRNPNEFIDFVESAENKEKRQKIAGTPFWGGDKIDTFRKAIKDSKYYDEIKEMIVY